MMQLSTTTQTNPNFCHTDDDCEFGKQCGMIKDSRFIPFNSETALVHAFFSVSENQYGRCVPTKTIKTSANIATPTEKQSTTFKMAFLDEENNSNGPDDLAMGVNIVLAVTLSLLMLVAVVV